MVKASRKNNKPKNPKRKSHFHPGFSRPPNRNRTTSLILLHRSFARCLRGRWPNCGDQPSHEEEDSQNQMSRVVKKRCLHRKWVRKRSRSGRIRKEGSIGSRSEAGGSPKAARKMAVSGKRVISKGFKYNRKGGFSVDKCRSIILLICGGSLLRRYSDGDCSLQLVMREFPPPQVSNLVGIEADVDMSFVVGGMFGCRIGCWEIRRGEGVGLKQKRSFGVHFSPERVRWSFRLVLESPFTRSEAVVWG